MKSKIILLFIASSLLVEAQAQDTITIVNEVEEVEVCASRVKQPTSNFEEIKQEELVRRNTGQNIPYLFATTPSVVVTSDDGLGVGYTYFRVRGTDHARINMTINDVPLNDAESQTVFWVNMTDIAESMEEVVVQRGVGSSCNGSAAFGASVNMQTLRPNLCDSSSSPIHACLAFNGGMYGTFREMVRMQAKLAPHWFFQWRFSKVNSDGYLYRTASDLYSYSSSISYLSQKNEAELLVFGGKEKTGMGWYGVSEEQWKANPRFNTAGMYFTPQGDTAYYDNQTDNYQQHHLHLHFLSHLTPTWKLRGTLHYTYGRGYYEEMDADANLLSYGLEKDTTYNLIRQKQMRNHFFGGVLAAKYISEYCSLEIATAANHYIGQQWGDLIDPDTIYYRNKGEKTDANIYAKATMYLLRRGEHELTGYADLQYRFVDYRITGKSDVDLTDLNHHHTYHFFNPKVGLSYAYRTHLLSASFALANREPSRTCFTECGTDYTPLPEQLFDYELGYTYSPKRGQLGINLYAMDYRNQLVSTGELGSTGAYLTKNVAKSYRLGAEISGGVHILPWFSWNANLTLSLNRIVGHTDQLDTYDSEGNYIGSTYMSFGNVAIAYSPWLTANNSFCFSTHGFEADIVTSVVSSQHLDNTGNKEAKLPAYTTTNIHLNYILPLPPHWPTIALHTEVNNVLNSRYCSNGGSYAYIEKNTAGELHLQSSRWLYAQAGINVHAGFRISW